MLEWGRPAIIAGLALIGAACTTTDEPTRIATLAEACNAGSAVLETAVDFEESGGRLSSEATDAVNWVYLYVDNWCLGDPPIDEVGAIQALAGAVAQAQLMLANERSE